MNGILLAILMAQPCVDPPRIELVCDPCSMATSAPTMSADGYRLPEFFSGVATTCAVNHCYEKRINPCRALVDPLKWSAGMDVPTAGGWLHVGGERRAQARPKLRFEEFQGTILLEDGR